MARSFNKLKNTYFWPIFGAKFFSGSVIHNFIWVSNTMPDLEKTSLTSRDTHKQYQNPSVTKTYSKRFNYDAELLYKK